MQNQKLREKRIADKLNLEKLPYTLKSDAFKALGSEISNFIHYVFSIRKKTKSLNWCFANVKRIKIFLQIFHANESGKESYKEEIAKNIPEYSYKTIAKIIDDGIQSGYFELLSPDGTKSRDNKIKNIRPSEELVTDFLNLGIEIISYIGKNKQ
jgi:folate-dependent phosphoribosylglycinamide formyltransferase PurN